MKPAKRIYTNLLICAGLTLATNVAFAQNHEANATNQGETFAAHLQATKSGLVYENPKTKGLSFIPVTVKQQAVQKQVDELLAKNKDKLLPLRVTANGYILIEVNDQNETQPLVDNAALY